MPDEPTDTTSRLAALEGTKRWIAGLAIALLLPSLGALIGVGQTQARLDRLERDVAAQAATAAQLADLRADVRALTVEVRQGTETARVTQVAVVQRLDRLEQRLDRVEERVESVARGARAR